MVELFHACLNPFNYTDENTKSSYYSIRDGGWRNPNSNPTRYLSQVTLETAARDISRRNAATFHCSQLLFFASQSLSSTAPPLFTPSSRTLHSLKPHLFFFPLSFSIFSQIASGRDLIFLFCCFCFTSWLDPILRRSRIGESMALVSSWNGCECRLCWIFPLSS